MKPDLQRSIQRLRELLPKITPGEWSPDWGNGCTGPKTAVFTPLSLDAEPGKACPVVSNPYADYPPYSEVLCMFPPDCQDDAEFIALARNSIEAILERNRELEAVWPRLLACHEDDAGICFDCRRELTRAGLLEEGNLGSPYEKWQKYFDMRNQVNALTLRVEELEAENARLKSGHNATALGCEPIFLRAASPRCKEFHGQIPYTSEHCWRQDHHGIPAGPCINCGEDYQAYTKRAHGEIALLPATRIDESDGKSWVCPTCKDPNCG